MATQLELLVWQTPAVMNKTVDACSVLHVGDKLKIELGDEQELDVVVPEGETWNVQILCTISVT